MADDPAPPGDPPFPHGRTPREASAFWARLYPTIDGYARKKVGEERAEDVAQAAARRVLAAGTWSVHDEKATMMAVGSAINSIATHARRSDKRSREKLERPHPQAGGDGEDAAEDALEKAGRMDGAPDSTPDAEAVAIANARRERARRVFAKAHEELAKDDRLGHAILDLALEGAEFDAEEQVAATGADLEEIYKARRRARRALEVARSQSPVSSQPGAADSKDAASRDRAQGGQGKPMSEGRS